MKGGCEGPDYRVVLRPQRHPEGLPPVLRLKAFLKRALRAYQLRAVLVEQERADGAWTKADGSIDLTDGAGI